MNKLELTVYNLVKDRPVFKQYIVNIYQAVLGCIPQKNILCKLSVQERRGHFYGFHDKCPFSADGLTLLAHKNLIGDRRVQPGDAVEVGFFRGAGWTQYQALGRTVGWNWQLGSMLQWFGTSNDRVVYNTVESSHVIGVVRGIDGQVHTKWPHPVVHVSGNGQYLCTYDFLRVEAAMRGYGVVVEKPKLDDERRNSFRIFTSDSVETSFEMSLAEAAAIAPHPSMEGAFHFFHHALFNPSGKRVFFLHRWMDVKQRLWTRMFSVGVNGESLYLFPMDEMVSHITWASDSEVFAYLRYPGIGDGYFLVEDQTGRAQRFFYKVLNSDGHPTMDKRRSIVITDTYPDRFRNQYLVLGLPKSGRCINLCRMHLPAMFKRELQVDLHPRLHPHSNVACIDSGHSGTRSLITVDFSSMVQ